MGVASQWAEPPITMGDRCGPQAGVATIYRGRWVWSASGRSPCRERISRSKTRYQSVIMACLMAAWSIHNPTVTNSIIMVSTLDWTRPQD